MPTIPELRKMVADARQSGRVSPEAAEAAVKKVAGRLADATAARTAGYVRDVRGQVSWHDPGTGRFAKAGWSTLKWLLMEAIDGFAEETSRNEPQGTWLTAKGDQLIHYGVRRGEAVKVRYGDARHGILDVNRDGNTVSLKVPWDAFEQRVTRPDAFRVEEPRYVGVISTGGALSGDAPRARITRGGGGLVEAAVDIDPELAPAGTVLWAEPTDATHATVVLPDGSRRKVGWAHFTDATPLESDGPTPGPVEWDNVPMFDAAAHRVPTVGETATHPAGLPDGTVVSTAVMGDHRDRWTVERGKLRGPDGKLYDQADFPTRAGTWRVVAPPGEPVDGRHDLSPIVFDVGAWERSKPWNATRRALERGDGPSWLRLGVGRGGEEASRHGDFIEVTPGFFRMPERGRRAVLWHEFGHGLDSLTTADGTAFHAYETMLDGPNFAPSKDTPGEMVAEAYALLHTDPQWLADNQPKLFAWVMASADKYGFPVPDRARDTIRSEPGAHPYRAGDTISDLADIRNGTRFEDRTGAVFTKVDGGATTARGAFVSDAYLRGDETSDGTPTLLAEPRTWTARDDVLSDEWAPTLFSGPPPDPDAAPTTWTLDHVVGSEFQQAYLKEWHDGTPFEGWGFKPSPYEGESHPVGRPLQSMWKGFVASPTTGRDVRGFHRLAADVFGLDTSLLDEITAERGTARELDLNAPDFELGYLLRDDGWHRGLTADETRKLVRTLHEHTQRMLADVGLDPNDRVLLYRGLGTTRARRWTEAGRPEFIEALPVAAFTTSFETAQRYGGDGGVITVEVRAGDILAAGLLHTNLAGEPDLVDEVNVLSPVDQPGFRVVGYTPPSAPGFDETFPDREAFVDAAKAADAPDATWMPPEGPPPYRKERWESGEIANFEYHCLESDESCDANLWRHTHQQVTVLGETVGYDRLDDLEGIESTYADRADAAMPRMYRIRFADGLEYDTTEDELFTDPAGWERPDHPDALEPVTPDGTRPTISASRSPADTERVTVAGLTDTVKATLNSRLTVEPDPDVQVDGEHVVVRLPDLPDAATAEQVTDAAVSKLADTLYPAAPTFADRIGIHDWPETKPWEATREQVDNGDFPFIRVNTDLPETVAARWVATEGVMEVPPHWFDATPDSRRMTLHHEVGHQVAIEIARGDAGELLAPFKRDRRIAVIGRAAAPTVEHKSPFSGMDDWGEHGDFPSEILADAYMELMSGNAGIYLDRAGVPELYDAVQEAAARLGMPTGDRDSRGTLIPDWTETDSDLRWRRKPSHDTQVDVARTGPRTFAWSMWHQNPDGTERFETGKARSLRKAQEAADEAAAAASSSAAFDITDLDEIVDAPMPPRDATAEFAALVDAADLTDRTALALTAAYTAAGFPDGTTEQVRSATNTSWVGFISDHEQTRGFHRIAARVFGRESRLGNVDRYSFQGDGPADEIGFVESIFDSKVHGFEGDAPADAALKALHEATQQTLRDAGIGPDDMVTVYRGVNQAQYIEWADAHLPDHLDSAPVAAFTTDPAVAEMYGPSGTFTLQVRAGDILSVGAIGTTDGAEILVLAPDTKPGFDVVKFESPNAARFMEANPDRAAFLAATTTDGAAPVVAFERATAGDLRRIDGAYDAVNPARAMKYDFGVDGFDADTLEALRVLAVGDDRVFSPVSNSTNVPAALVVELPYDITDANVAQAQADARAVIADAIYGKPDHEHAPDAPAREPVRPGPAQDGHEADARPEGRAGRSGAATAADLTELVGFSGNVPHDADPEVKAAAVTVADRFLAADLGDGYRSKVTNVYAPGGTSTVDVTGVIYGPNGEQVGVFDRRFTGALALGHIQTPYTWEEGGFGDPSKFIDNPGGLATGVSVEHYRIELDPAHQGSGVGSRFLAASIDQYRAAGVDQMTTHAVTNPETGYIGAYVWAKAGFDWAEGVGVDDVRAIGYSMLSIDPDSPLGETLATWDGVLTPDFPTPLDVASDPAGRQALLAGGGWYGWIPLSDRAAAIKRAMSTAPPNPVFPDATPHQRALLGRFATEPSTFKTIAEHLGFDKPPTTVDAEEFAAATGWMLAGSDGLDIEQVRARSGVAETPLGEGIPFFGSHGDSAPTAILRPTANVISADSLQPGLDAARAAALAIDGPAGAAARAVTENMGRYAAFLGYDAITTDDGALVLNRSALIIPPTLPRKALRASYEQVAESRGAAWWQREPVSFSGLKAHVRADSVDDVREVIDRLSPLVDSNDIGIKAATAGMLTLLADHDAQHGKGVTVYFPRHADEWATLQAVAAALDGYTPSRGGIPPGSDKPTEGLPEFIGLRHEFDWPGYDVTESWEYRSLYRGATVDEPAVTPDQIGGYTASSPTETSSAVLTIPANDGWGEEGSTAKFAQDRVAAVLNDTWTGYTGAQDIRRAARGQVDGVTESFDPGVDAGVDPVFDEEVAAYGPPPGFDPTAEPTPAEMAYQALMARTMIRRVNQSPPTGEPTHRAVVLGDAAAYDRFMADAVVGNVVNVPLMSTISDRYTASKYAVGDRHSVVFEINEDAPGYSTPEWVGNYQEYVQGGMFEIVAVEDRVETVDVYSPSDHHDPDAYYYPTPIGTKDLHHLAVRLRYVGPTELRPSNVRSADGTVLDSAESGPPVVLPRPWRDAPVAVTTRQGDFVVQPNGVVKVIRMNPDMQGGRVDERAVRSEAWRQRALVSTDLFGTPIPDQRSFEFDLAATPVPRRGVDGPIVGGATPSLFPDQPQQVAFEWNGVPSVDDPEMPTPVPAYRDGMAVTSADYPNLPVGTIITVDRPGINGATVARWYRHDETGWVHIFDPTATPSTAYGRPENPAEGGDTAKIVAIGSDVADSSPGIYAVGDRLHARTAFDLPPHTTFEMTTRDGTRQWFYKRSDGSILMWDKSRHASLVDLTDGQFNEMLAGDLAGAKLIIGGLAPNYTPRPPTEKVDTPPGPPPPLSDALRSLLDGSASHHAAVAAAATIFNGDIGDGYRSETTAALVGSGNTVINGTIIDPDGYTIGKWQRTVHYAHPRRGGQTADGFVTVSHDSFTLNDGYRGKGVGTRFLAAAIAAYGQAGVDQVLVAAQSDAMLNGAYTWAKLGFDWSDTFIETGGVQGLGRAILDAEPGSPIGRLLAEAVSVADPDLPTPFDVASDPTGKKVLLGGRDRIAWSGFMPVSERAGKPRQPVISTDTPVDLSAVAAGGTEAPTATLHQSRGGPTISYGDMVWSAPSGTDDWDSAYAEWTGYEGNWGMRRASAALLGMPVPESYGDDVGAPEVHDIVASGVSAGHPEWAAKQARARIGYAVTAMNAVYDGALSERSAYRGMADVPPDAPIMQLAAGDKIDMPLSAFTPNAAAADHYMIPNGGTASDIGNGSVLVKLRPGAAVAKATDDYVDGWVDPDTGDFVQDVAEYITYGQFEVVDVSTDNRGVRVIELTHKAIPHPLWPDHNLGEPSPPDPVPVTETPADPLADLYDYAAELGIDVWLSRNPHTGAVSLDKIVVPKEARKGGIGSQFMDRLVERADAEGVTLSLTPPTDYGATSKARLEKFYRRFGFKKNGGRHPEISDSMVRKPDPNFVPDTQRVDFPEPTMASPVERPEWADGEFVSKTGATYFVVTEPKSVTMRTADGTLVGYVNWGDNSVIGNMNVVDAYQRQGVATELLRRGRIVDPQLEHSDRLSDDAMKWLDAIGESPSTATPPSRVPAPVAHPGSWPSDPTTPTLPASLVSMPGSGRPVNLSIESDSFSGQTNGTVILADAATGARVGHLSYTTYAGRTTVTSVSVDPAVASEPVADTMLGYAIANDPGTVFESNLTDAAGLAWWRDAKQSFPTANIAARPQQTPFVQSTTDLMDRIHDGPTVDDRATATRAAETLFNLGLGNGWQTTVSNVEPVRSDKRSGTGIKVSGKVFNGATATGTWSAVISTVGADPYSEATLTEQAAGLTVTLTDLSSNAVGSRLAASQIVTGLVDRFAETGVEQFGLSGDAPQAVRTIAAKAGWQWVDVASVPDGQKQTVFDAIRGVRDAIPESMWTDPNIDNDALNDMSSLFGQWDGESELPTPFDVETLAPGVVGRSDAPMTIGVAAGRQAPPPVALHAAPSGREAMPAEIAGFLPETQFRLSTMPDVTFGVNHEGNVYSVDDPFVGSSPAADVAALVANVGATVTVEREPSIPKIETAPELGSGRPKFGTDGWDELAANAFSAGRVTREQLAELGMTDDKLRSMARRVSGGKADDWTPLPDRLWHVTTAADLVEAEGLKRRADTGQGGLGGSHTHISMASDLGHAEAIYDGLREAVSVARGDVTARRLVNRAIAGDLGSAPFADDGMFVAEVRRLTGVDDWTPGDAVPDLPPDRTLDLWRRFAYSRMKAGGPRDPLVLTDADVLAKVDLDQVAIMEFAPNGATYGTQLGLDAASADAGEWRLASGEAVKLVRRVPRAKAAWETADQAAAQPWKADDISGGRSTVNGVTDMFGPNPTSEAIIDAMKVVAYRSEADPGGAPPTVMAVGAKGYRWEAQIASTVDMLRTESMDPGSVRIFDIGDPELPEVIQAVFESSYGVAFELADMRMNEWTEPEMGLSPVMDLAAQQMLGRSERIIESVFDGADTIHVAHNQTTGLLERVPAGTEGAFELPRSATLRGVMRDDVACLDMPAYQRRAITGETFDWSALDAASMPSARVAALAAQRAKLLSMLPGGDGESHRWFPTQQGMLERVAAGEPSVADQEALASHALVSEFGSRARALIADIADTAWKRRMRRSSAYLDALTDQNVMLPEAESARIRSGLSRLFRDPDTFEPFDGVDAEGITAAFQESQHGQRVSKVYRTASGHVMIDFITPPGSYPEHVGVGINPDTGEFWMSHVANGSVRYTTMGTLPDQARAAARAFTDATSARWDEHASTRDLWRSSVLQAHRKVFTDMGIDMSDFEDIVVDGGGEVGTLADLPSSSPVAITARTGLDVYPRAWRERLAGMRLNFTLNRGDAAVGEGSAAVRKLRDAATADIVVPDVNDAPWYADIVGHEFGHIMQSVVPGIRSAEMWHILSRITPGEKPVRRKYAGQTVDFLEDHFVDPYTGRLYNSPEMNDYGFGPFGSFEVFTTGVQGLYDTGHRAAAKFNADPQLRDFTIGVMASVHVPAAAEVVDVAAESLADFGYNADLRDAPNVDDEETGWTLPDDLPHLLDAPDTETAVAQTRRALAAAAESAVSDGLVIRVPPRVLDRILGSGAVLPQTETGQSEGMFNPDRRSRWERNAFGIPGTFEGPRPVYAMVASPNLTTSTGDHYGLVGLRLKPEVAGRATFSLGDSLDMTAPVGFGDIDTASPAEIAATVGVEGPDVIHAANNGSMLDGHYVEAQIHGGVPIGDIASVISYGTPTSEIRGFAEALGVPVQVVPTDDPALTYGEVARADQTALQLLGGTYTVEDIRALLRSGDLTAVQRAALHEMLTNLGAEPSQAE